MKKAVAVLGVVIMMAAMSAGVEAADVEKPGGVAGYQENMPDDTETEESCDCCQKCNAARRNTLSEAEKKKEKKPDHPNGCKDCCERCGKPVPPATEDTPPEVIEKEIPPELKDNQRRQQ